MDRRDFLRRAGVATAGSALLSGAAAGQADPEANNTPVDGTTAYRPKIETIRSPLAGVPAILATGDTLRVELDPAATPNPLDDPTADLRAVLTPSFGAAATATELTLERVGSTPASSAIWNADEGEDAAVLVAEFAIPATGGTFTPDLYDLEVSWSGASGQSWSDSQPRAVRVYDGAVPADLDVVVIADPQIGDPRALQSGAEEAAAKQTPTPLVERTTRTTGQHGTDRWEATRRAIAEVNATDPDVVLLAGDLTFGQDAPGKYYEEYEDAWAIVNELRAPCYCTMGNHDGIVQSGVDGKALYRETFGPPSYAVDVGDHRIVAVDTFDWNYLDRLGFGLAVSSYGGQVRAPQYRWLAEEALDPAADSLITFGHHNPSWQPDPENRFRDQAEGTPVIEQVARGLRYAESGQLWTGVNQFALRELFDERDVDVFFAGHSHRDRLARTIPARGDGAADIAETHSQRTASPGFHYVAYSKDGSNETPGEYSEYDWSVDPDGRSDRSIAALIRGEGGRSGTLYVTCTTSQSGTSQYWGWRPLTVSATGGVDATDIGYPWPSEDALDARVVDPTMWRASDGDDVGLYSHPSYLLGVDRSDAQPAAQAAAVTGPPESASVTLTNDLAVDVSGATTLSVAPCEGVSVDGGRVVWTRTGEAATDVKVAYDVPSGTSRTITVSCR